MYQRFCVIAITALVMVTVSESAFSAKKKLGAANADCSCSCFKDGSTGEGPTQRTTVYFDSPGGGDCTGNGGGCRIQQADGSYRVGTLRNCRTNLDKVTPFQGGNNSEGAPVLSTE